MLVLFSDGVTEAADPRGEEFGEERLARTGGFAARPSRGGDRGSGDPAVAAFTEGAPAADDITVVAVRRL